MRTSARNALSGVVSQVLTGSINDEVVLTIGDGVEIVAVITKHSVDHLGLKPGIPVTALIKSSFVILAPDTPGLRTSARNHFSGAITELEEGAVNSEVVLDIGAGKTLTAVITRESAKELGLAVGGRAAALVKASHVILAVD
ncbi:MAG: TOBE domain-containing protein [Caulobacteraceae bacterium]